MSEQRSEDTRVGWFLPAHCLNSIQVESIGELLRIAKHAHMIDVKVRINGQDRWFQVDWLKSMEKTS